MITVDAITRIPLFNRLKGPTLGDICPMLRRQDIPAGTQIFREGGEARELYYLDEGRIDITIREPHPGGSGGGLVHIVRPGECFGWSALVPPHFFTASARAHVVSAVFVVNADLLKLQMDRHPDLAKVVMENIAATIAHRLEGTRIRMLTLSLGDAAGRRIPAETYLG